MVPPQFYRALDGLWYPVPEPIPLRVLIRAAILNALAYYDGHQRLAAKALGISERTMHQKMRTYGIPRARS